ncbi:class I SAM-dependent methyltransferase [Methylosinus sp. Sm6]|nr:class I SAM-dependent methyltransferase [Methylosinus sp. Sm6]MBY6240222.1 class I SAM-dependent methyltransferase [Methylosinus sp. Sm6]
MGEHGDFGREFILDPALRDRLARRSFARALDVGCGEGRLCRMLREFGVEAVGIDPTEPLLDEARRRDPTGDYRHGRAEELAFDDESFDLVISCLTLIDIDDASRAIAEMARVLRPGGILLIANLTSFGTAGIGEGLGWAENAEGEKAHFRIDNYLQEKPLRVSWRGISVTNWHRPLGSYFSALLGAGLRLEHFSEPTPRGCAPDLIASYERMPYFLLMEWSKDRAPPRVEAGRSF